jgi:hypothetical protein
MPILNKDLAFSEGGNNNRWILAVDDEYDILDIIQKWLQLDGSKVCTFADPLAAIEHFSSYCKYHNIASKRDALLNTRLPQSFFYFVQIMITS